MNIYSHKPSHTFLITGSDHTLTLEMREPVPHGPFA